MTKTPNQAIQRTASKAATDVLRVCHPPFGCVARFPGLAVADLVSRKTIQMWHYPMPWSLKAVIAMFVVFAAGAVLIGFACFESGWQALGHLAWGLLTAGVGLVGGLLFAIICAATQPAWRKQSLFAGAVALLLLAGLVLFARAA